MHRGRARRGAWLGAALVLLTTLTCVAAAAAASPSATQGHERRKEAEEQGELRLRTTTVDAAAMAHTAPGRPGALWSHATAVRREQRWSSPANSSSVCVQHAYLPTVPRATPVILTRVIPRPAPSRSHGRARVGPRTVRVPCVNTSTGSVVSIAALVVHVAAVFTGGRAEEI